MHIQYNSITGLYRVVELNCNGEAYKIHGYFEDLEVAKKVLKGLILNQNNWKFVKKE